MDGIQRPDEVLDPGFIPRYLAIDSALYQSLFGEQSIMSLGLDLSKSAAEAVADGFGTGIWYVLLVVLLGVLYFGQQRMVAARASISPTMSAGQQKLMQYLPVFFAVFQIFFLAALVVYYIFQTLLPHPAAGTTSPGRSTATTSRWAARPSAPARPPAKRRRRTRMAAAADSLRRPSAISPARPPTPRTATPRNSNTKKPAAKDAKAAKPAPTTSKRVHAAEEPPDAVVGGEGSADADSSRGTGQQGEVEEVRSRRVRIPRRNHPDAPALGRHVTLQQKEIRNMEWVETTAKTIEAAREAALDQLGVGADEAEFDVIEEPRPGLFGRIRGEARLRARVRPAQVRPKQERRRKGRSDGGGKSGTSSKSATTATDSGETAADDAPSTTESTSAKKPATKKSPETGRSASANGSTSKRSKQNEEQKMTNEDRPESTVTPDEVGAAAVAFMDGLTEAFGLEGSSTLQVDDLELRVDVTGSELGLLVGPGGRTLNAIQDLARVSAQRRLGDHETRLRIDVAGYRERREAALSAFARDVAEQVRTSGTARSLEAMSSSDRKVVHDVLNDETGVSSRSVGEDPDRRIIVEPA